MAGRSWRMGTGNLPARGGLQAGPVGAWRQPGGWRPRESSFGGGAATGHAAGTDIGNAGDRLVGPARRSGDRRWSGRGRLRPVRRERSGADRVPQGLGLVASGGWRQRKRFGHDGFGGAQHRGDQRARVEMALAGGAHDTGQHLLGVRPAPGAVAAADLAGDHRGADGLLGPPVGGVDRRVAQEEEHRREFVGQVLGEALGGGQRRRVVDQSVEPGGESAAGRRQTVLADFARIAAVPQGEAVLQDRLHRTRPGVAGMSGLQVLATAQEVPNARLGRRVLEAAIDHPPVPHQHAGEVGAENLGRMLEPPPVADGVDRRLRRDERPQPVAQRVHPPAGLIRRDHRTAADLLAQRRIRGRRRGGGAVQQLDQAALGHRQSELVPQNARHLLQRHAQLGVQLDDQRGDVRAQLGGGRAQRIRGLQRVPALHAAPTPRAVTHLDVEAPHEGTHLRQIFLILGRHTVKRDRAAAVGARRRGRRRIRLVNPCRRLAASVLPVLRAGSTPGRPAASLWSVLGEGGRLSASGAPRRLELLLQMLAAALPAISILDQLRLVSLEAFDAPHVPRVPLRPRILRVATVALLARHTSRIGTCPSYLHTFSWVFSPRPANRRQVEHIQPKDLYPCLVFVWTNYVYACGHCNRGKTNKFAVISGDRLVDVTRPRGGPVVPPEPGAPAFLNPRVEDPLRFLDLDLEDTFTVVARYDLPDIDRERTDFTIDTLKLNRDVLRKARATALGPIARAFMSM